MTYKLRCRLSAYREAKEKVNDLDVLIEELETLLLPSGIRYDRDKIQTSPSDAMSEVITKVSLLQRKRDEMIRKVVSEYDALNAFLNNLTDYGERQVMKYVWIRGFTIEETAEAVSYSVSWVNKTIKNATARLEELA